MSTLNVSAISYLNTVPLMYDFEHPPRRESLAADFNVRYTLPSHCAEELRMGAADIGIVPVAAYSSIPDLAIVPGVSIAAKNPVRSILLVSKREIGAIGSVATDTSSRTSVALLKVLFQNHFHAAPDFVEAPPDASAMLARHDAALLIGDPALRLDPADGRYLYVDLAQEWQKMTGLPFVFAFWTVRGAVADLARGLDVADVFQSSRDAGLTHAGELARESAAAYGVTRELALRYLTFHIDYALDSLNLKGLSLFFELAAKCGALPEAPPLRFL